ncbi:MAG: MOSC N-terminal beta barrel domain-containing protein [Pseudomonadota bacterium]|nr:MOSC N-terminal beta barrel domain-containing protein [Pseudomonadota bacterium]
MMPVQSTGLKMRVASLHIYPIKSARGVNLSRARLENRGLEGDRRWLAVDSAGAGVTQRSHPGLATIAVRSSPAGLRLSAPGAADIEVATPDGASRADILIWDDPVSAALADEAAHRWISDVLGDRLRLVFMDGDARREKTGVWVSAPTPTSFADSYPVLVTTTGSLKALNDEITGKGGAPVGMERFRPNIVIDCDDAWREDCWRRLQIGPAEIVLVKPCDRCVVTTKNQSTGESMGKEPLASLARLRRSADPRINGVLFGWNGAPLKLGEIAVGDSVEVLETRPEGFPLALR